MTKIAWRAAKFVKIGEQKIFVAENIKDGYKQGSGIKRDSRVRLIAKKACWPALKLFADLFVDGFIERNVGRLIRRYMTNNAVFLEIGCGDMSLRRFVAKNNFYNALDLELSEFHLRRLAGEKNVNVIIASATDIPVESDSVSMIVATEVFEHIPEINVAMREIHRIASSKAILICSIPNNFCLKYFHKGPHPGHINSWTFDAFKTYMEGNGFALVLGFMAGWWLPLPLWLTRVSIQLPFSSKEERYNTNFFFAFRALKKGAEGTSSAD